jgi:hypothetical protein
MRAESAPQKPHRMVFVGEPVSPIKNYAAMASTENGAEIPQCHDEFDDHFSTQILLLVELNAQTPPQASGVSLTGCKRVIRLFEIDSKIRRPSKYDWIRLRM